ncbi:bifunctional aldolase/short-chain dehydrogenase [Magnetococcales bacterium HHB-1]
MKNRWSQKSAERYVTRYGPQWGEALALRIYSNHLLGEEPALVLHGGGNTSVKNSEVDLLGERRLVLYIKGSGKNLPETTPEDHTALNLTRLIRMHALDALDDQRMMTEVRAQQIDPNQKPPSIEALMHAFLPHTFVDHTHPDAILALSNQKSGEEKLHKALGKDILFLPYVKPGFALAKAVLKAFEKRSHAKAMVLMQHGLITWGNTAEESYQRTIDLVSKAERFLVKQVKDELEPRRSTGEQEAKDRYINLVMMLRGLLTEPTGHADRPHKTPIILPLVDEETLEFVNSEQGKALALTPPLTTDHLIRTKPFNLWVEKPDDLSDAVTEFRTQYEAYFKRNQQRYPEAKMVSSNPCVVMMPGVGCFCLGETLKDAEIARDITRQTIQAKRAVICSGGMYQGLSEEHLFDMEYFPLQQAKLRREKCHNAALRPLGGRVAIVSGAAGAIGSGICRSLLKKGCLVGAADLPGEHLDSLIQSFEKEFPGRSMAVPMDVTIPEAVEKGFDLLAFQWGGVDLVVINAGLAHVSSLADMQVAAFQRLQRVNVEGTLHMLSSTSRRLVDQGCGGDVVLISTKNVFCPGANFGAYSATKAASHQLARIASLELADKDIRVNMVSPDGVFSDGARKSGLWAEVGPDRMKARNLTETGLESYYQNRNLLKAKITAEHVANAVLFYALRQTPTTGATIPVDGGLPDSTPR